MIRHCYHVGYTYYDNERNYNIAGCRLESDEKILTADQYEQMRREISHYAAQDFEDIVIVTVNYLGELEVGRETA